MSISDRMGDTAEQAKDQIGKVGDKADSATGGKFGEAIDKGEEAAQSAADKLSKKNKNKKK